MYNNGEVKKGDIVFQQYSKNYCNCFFNGKWLKSIYNSKIKDGNEIEDDINILSTSIIDISNSLTDISTRLYNDYLTNEQYIKDEQLIASTFAELDTKINSIDISDDITELKKTIQILNKNIYDVSLTLYTLTETEDINNTIDTFKEVENFLNNISDSSTLTELLLNTKNDIIDGISEYYYNIDEIDNKINNINTSITNIQNDIQNIDFTSLKQEISNEYIKKTEIDNIITSSISDTNKKLNDVSLKLNNISIYVTNISTNLFDISNRLNDSSTRLNDISVNLNDTSTRLNDSSVRLIDISTRLYNDYLTKNQYLKDEQLIASTFNELNNKINSLQEELNELKNKTN